MSRVKAVKPQVEAQAAFKFGYLSVAAPCLLAAAPTAVPRNSTLKGSCVLPVDVAAELFRIGEGFVRLDDTGPEYPVRAVALTAGDGKVYLELRV